MAYIPVRYWLRWLPAKNALPLAKRLYSSWHPVILPSKASSRTSTAAIPVSCLESRNISYMEKEALKMNCWANVSSFPLPRFIRSIMTSANGFIRKLMNCCSCPAKNVCWMPTAVSVRSRFAFTNRQRKSSASNSMPKPWQTQGSTHVWIMCEMHVSSSRMPVHSWSRRLHIVSIMMRWSWILRGKEALRSFWMPVPRSNLKRRIYFLWSLYPIRDLIYLKKKWLQSRRHVSLWYVSDERSCGICRAAEAMKKAFKPAETKKTLCFSCFFASAMYFFILLFILSREYATMDRCFI